MKSKESQANNHSPEEWQEAVLQWLKKHHRPNGVYHNSTGSNVVYVSRDKRKKMIYVTAFIGDKMTELQFTFDQVEKDPGPQIEMIFKPKN